LILSADISNFDRISAKPECNLFPPDHIECGPPAD
jgi:hypothetical protein